MRSERRTIHLGVDLFAPSGTPVRAALAGTVHLVADNAAPLDYGPLVVLRHVSDEGDDFFTLYGHLTRASLERLAEGQPICAGDSCSRQIGSADVNGGWTPHLHFQVITDLLDLGRGLSGVCRRQRILRVAGALSGSQSAAQAAAIPSAHPIRGPGSRMWPSAGTGSART